MKNNTLNTTLSEQLQNQIIERGNSMPLKHNYMTAHFSGLIEAS